MQFMMLIYDPPKTMELTPEDWAAAMPEWGAYGELLKARNAFVAGNALTPTTSATTVRLRDGQRVVTDGPFAETKEWLSGYYLLECASLDEALDLAAHCPAAKYGGSLEVRPVVVF